MTGRRHHVARRLGTAVAIVLALLVPVSCAPLGSGLSDPCLLQLYQTRGFSIVHDIQSGLGTVTSHVDALAPQPSSISPSQDVSETLTALSEFRLTLAAEWNLVRTGSNPPQGSAFTTDIAGAIGQFDEGVAMLTQAYAAEENGDQLAANAIATGARVAMRSGRILLARANSAIAALNTYSPNC
jgi:hypothetical protein